MADSKSIVIPESELEERFIRASGPGGQNVNKVSSAVELRFDVRASPSLPERVREVLLPRLTRDGILLIRAQRFRDQERNRADARDRLHAIIARAAVPVKPRRPTRIPKASRKQRLEGKKRRASLKQGRATPRGD